jgi:hypothetical protein|tara:strand:+ start:1103 stop:1312 length:210 start_codon:yes stop_codon:yes gene_type:complete
MKQQLIDGLIAKYNGDIGAARANVQVYLTNPAGIGDHPDIIAAIDVELIKIAEAEDKLLALDKHFTKDW